MAPQHDLFQLNMLAALKQIPFSTPTIELQCHYFFITKHLRQQCISMLLRPAAQVHAVLAITMNETTYATCIPQI